MCSCDEIKINEARDHLFFTIMSRSGAIIFELTHKGKWIEERKNLVQIYLKVGDVI